MKRFLLTISCAAMACGCTVVSENRVFPKLAWYWSADAKQQRADNKEHAAAVKAYQDSLSKTNQSNP